MHGCPKRTHPPGSDCCASSEHVFLFRALGGIRDYFLFSVYSQNVFCQKAILILSGEKVSAKVIAMPLEEFMG